MNIIFVSNSMSKPRVLTAPQLAALLLLLVAVVAGLTAAIILPQAESKHQGVKSILPSALHFPIFNAQEHLDALALQLGEIQARVIRLDAISERLSKLAGVKAKDVEAERLPPGQGGPEIRPYGMTEAQLQQKIVELTTDIESRTDKLSLVEAMLLQQSMQKNALPTSYPVQGAYNSSSYGWRVDPFSGRMAFHEGLDFTAEVGSSIRAAAGGIVMSAEQTPDYGKIVKIDHGSGLETRYAHASKLLVKAGERVEKGQLIAEVGNTGRSTGAHLHFEVRLNGAALDPRKYLQSDILSAKL
ncbi:MAG: M23 family metallopeptidase [Candidatus Methylopumilus sp.]|jgi:murein DD-endopeptidase MepM/ murein hydrolase activator NlpD